MALPAAFVVWLLPWILTPATSSRTSLTTLPAAALPLGRLPDTWILKLSFKTLTLLGIDVELNMVALTATLSLTMTGMLTTVLLTPESSIIAAVNAKLPAALSLSFWACVKPAGMRTV